jgi:hypothetical protein
MNSIQYPKHVVPGEKLNDDPAFDAQLAWLIIA